MAVRRFPFAFLLLGLLGLLAAGALILGLFASPTLTANVAVHDGAGYTLGASRVAGKYTATDLQNDVISFVYTAPDTATEVARGPKGAVKRRSVVGKEATSILSPIRELSTLHDFVEQQDGAYVSTEPITQLVPASERGEISGTYRTTVRIAGGYVVGIDLDIKAIEEGQPLDEVAAYKLTSVGSWRS